MKMFKAKWIHFKNFPQAKCESSKMNDLQGSCQYHSKEMKAKKFALFHTQVSP